jgi:hypothetical protein
LAKRTGEIRRIGGSTAWLLLPLLALVEVAGHGVIRARVPDRDDWQRAADFVAGELTPTDAVTVAPPWADPLLRRVLGQHLSLAQAAPSDLAPFERQWALSIRGHRPAEAPARPPDLTRQFGRVQVWRWDLGPSPVLYDLVEHVHGAEVSLGVGDAARPCPRRVGGPNGGGLGAGPARPAQRFECDPRRPWLWVGQTVTEDLHLQPRHCVWQHPAAKVPVRVRYRDVPLGDRIVLHAGLYYEHERERKGGPVHVNVRVDGEPVGHLVHRDGDGWKRMEAHTGHTASGGVRGTVEVEVVADDPHLRSLCWAASIREGER